LDKLARQSQRNWKKRYFLITPYYLVYYADEKSLDEPKGHVMFDSDSRVEVDEAGYGFGFKITTKKESLFVSSTTDTDRKAWMTMIAACIEFSKLLLADTMTIIDHTKYMAKHGKGPILDLVEASKFVHTKYLVLSDRYLSVHHDVESIVNIDHVLEIDSMTIMRRLMHSAPIYELRDCYGNILWLKFDESNIVGRTVTEKWRNKLREMLDFNDVVKASNEPANDSKLNIKALVKEATRVSLDLTIESNSASRPSSVPGLADVDVQRESTVEANETKEDGEEIGPMTIKPMFGKSVSQSTSINNNSQPTQQSSFVSKATSSKTSDSEPQKSSYGRQMNLENQRMTATPASAASPSVVESMESSSSQGGGSSSSSLNALERARLRKQQKKTSISPSTISTTTYAHSPSATANTRNDSTPTDPLLSTYKSYMKTNLMKLNSYLDDDVDQQLAAGNTAECPSHHPTSFADQQDYYEGDFYQRDRKSTSSTISIHDYSQASESSDKITSLQDAEEDKSNDTKAIESLNSKSPGTTHNTATSTSTATARPAGKYSRIRGNINIRTNSSKPIEAATTIPSSEISPSKSIESLSYSQKEELAAKPQKTKTNDSDIISETSAVKFDLPAVVSTESQGHSASKYNMEKLKSNLNNESTTPISIQNALKSNALEAAARRKNLKQNSFTSSSSRPASFVIAVATSGAEASATENITSEDKLYSESSSPQQYYPAQSTVSHNAAVNQVSEGGLNQSTPSTSIQAAMQSNALEAAARRKKAKQNSIKSTVSSRSSSFVSSTTTATTAPTYLEESVNDTVRYRGNQSAAVEGRNENASIPMQKISMNEDTNNEITKTKTPKKRLSLVPPPPPPQPVNSKPEVVTDSEIKMLNIVDQSPSHHPMSRSIFPIVNEHTKDSWVADDRQSNPTQSFHSDDNDNNDSDKEKKLDLLADEMTSNDDRRTYSRSIGALIDEANKAHSETLLERSPKLIHTQHYQQQPSQLTLTEEKIDPLHSFADRISTAVNLEEDLVKTGYVSALDMFKVAQNKPAVRIVFENYAFQNKYMDSTSLETASYDLGCYMNSEEVSTVLKSYSSSRVNNYPVLNYDDFQVFWRDHFYFRSIRFADLKFKRRVFIASKFKQSDLLNLGHLKFNLFHKVHQECVEEGYLNPRKHKIEAIIKKLDDEKRGKIYLNQFLEWIDNVRSITCV
jgi:hypothetical protein